MGCSSSLWNSGWERDMNNEQLRANLTERQVQLIKATWDIISDDLEGTGVKIFKRLFETEPDIKSLFVRLESQTPTEEVQMDDCLLAKHAKGVMEALGAAVECLENTEFLTKVLVGLGQIHFAYRVKASQLPRLWPSIRYGLKDTLQDVFTDEVETTWKIVFNFIINKMREGIKAEQKNQNEISRVSTSRVQSRQSRFQ